MSGWLRFVLVDVVVPALVAGAAIFLYHTSVHDDTDPYDEEYPNQ